MRTIVCKLCRQHPPSPHPGMVKGYCVQCSLTSRRLRKIHQAGAERSPDEARYEEALRGTCHTPRNP